MGHDPPYTVPNYKTFQVAGIRQLEELEHALEQRGLKDPWIRNEAWRFHPAFGTRASRAIKLFTRGMPIGIVTGALAAGAGYLMGGDDHDHESHGGH